MKSEKTTDKKHRAYLVKYIQELKSTTPCMDCKELYPYYVMDFDHVRGRKHKNVMELIPTLSKKKIDEEIAKCEIVCSNCHRVRTHKRKSRKANER
jgi:lysyl-tRNA synthetase class I